MRQPYARNARPERPAARPTVPRLALAGTLAVALVPLGFEVYHANRVLPGVRVEGQVVGGLPPDAARERIAAQAGAASPWLTVLAPDQAWRLDLREVGWRADPAATASAAFAVGRSGSLFERLAARWRAVQGGVELALEAAVDEAALRARLEGLAASFARSPQNARLLLRAGRYVPAQELDGRALDVPGALLAFRRDPGVRELRLEPKPIPADLTAQELVPLAARANALLRPLTLRYGRGEGRAVLALTPAQVVNLFYVRRSGLEPDRAAIQRTLRSFAARHDRPAANARFEAGAVQPARPGWGLLLEPAAEQLAGAVLDPAARTLELPVGALAPVIGAGDLARLKALPVVAEATTDFAGSSPERATNVRVAASRLDGTTIESGGAFDFNAAIGEISRENGYRGALIISGGRTVEGVGGGVCQVSTTAFRAFYSGGYPVLERNPHAYRVRYYGTTLGIDAAVYQPYLNLRMRNDTGGPLLIRAAVTGTRLTVRIQGAPLERRVAIQSIVLDRTPFPPPVFEFDPRLPPGARRQVDWAVDGYRVRVTRTITDANGARAETLATTYRPWRAVYRVGPQPRVASGTVSSARALRRGAP